MMLLYLSFDTRLLFFTRNKMVIHNFVCLMAYTDHLLTFGSHHYNHRIMASGWAVNIWRPVEDSIKFNRRA